MRDYAYRVVTALLGSEEALPFPAECPKGKHAAREVNCSRCQSSAAMYGGCGLRHYGNRYGKAPAGSADEG